MAGEKLTPMFGRKDVGFGPTPAEQQIINRLLDIAQSLATISEALENISQYGVVTHIGRE